MLNATTSMTDPEASTRSASPTAPGMVRRSRRPPNPPVQRQGGLVLTRHLGESIMIGGSVEIQVVGLPGGKVRLRVIAPREVAVHRREVFDAIRAEAEQDDPRAGG